MSLPAQGSQVFPGGGGARWGGFVCPVPSVESPTQEKGQVTEAASTFFSERSLGLVMRPAWCSARDRCPSASAVVLALAIASSTRELARARAGSRLLSMFAGCSHNCEFLYIHPVVHICIQHTCFSAHDVLHIFETTFASAVPVNKNIRT